VPQTPVSWYTNEPNWWPANPNGSPWNFTFNLSWGSSSGGQSYWQGSGSARTGTLPLPRLSDGVLPGFDWENSGSTIWDRISNFFEQASRSFGIFDNFVPSRASFESGAGQFWGPCFYDCLKHDIIVKSTADVFQGGGQGVAEVGNRYYPELAKTALLSLLPEAIAARPLTTGEKFFEGATLHARVIKQMETGDYHAFPYSIDELAKRQGTVATVLDSRGTQVQMLTYKGKYDGKMGTFEYIKNSSNQIYHRFFDTRKP
jgi:hypothetical protein